MSRNRSGWTAGADRIAARDWSGEVVQMPSGRLHAVSDPGLVQGRALCLAPVTLLDRATGAGPTTAMRNGRCAGSASR
jgi:hypothetical protein